MLDNKNFHLGMVIDNIRYEIASMHWIPRNMMLSGIYSYYNAERNDWLLYADFRNIHSDSKMKKNGYLSLRWRVQHDNSVLFGGFLNSKKQWEVPNETKQRKLYDKYKIA